MPTPPQVVAPDLVTHRDETSDAPMTEVQAVKLRTLCDKLDEPFDGNLTERQASKRIAALEEIDNS